MKIRGLLSTIAKEGKAAHAFPKTCNSLAGRATRILRRAESQPLQSQPFAATFMLDPPLSPPSERSSGEDLPECWKIKHEQLRLFFGLEDCTVSASSFRILRGAAKRSNTDISQPANACWTVLVRVT